MPERSEGRTRVNFSKFDIRIFNYKTRSYATLTNDSPGRVWDVTDG